MDKQWFTIKFDGREEFKILNFLNKLSKEIKIPNEDIKISTYGEGNWGTPTTKIYYYHIEQITK